MRRFKMNQIVLLKYSMYFVTCVLLMIYSGLWAQDRWYWVLPLTVLCAILYDWATLRSELLAKGEQDE